MKHINSNRLHKWQILKWVTEKSKYQNKIFSSQFQTRNWQGDTRLILFLLSTFSLHFPTLLKHKDDFPFHLGAKNATHTFKGSNEAIHPNSRTQSFLVMSSYGASEQTLNFVLKTFIIIYGNENTLTNIANLNDLLSSIDTYICDCFYNSQRGIHYTAQYICYSV